MRLIALTLKDAVDSASVVEQDLGKEWGHILTERLPEHALTCSGWGAGDSPYLVIPAAFARTDLPLVVERLGNHIGVNRTRFLCFLFLSGPEGINTTTVQGRVDFLDIEQATNLARSLQKSGITLFDISGQHDCLDATDRSGRAKAIVFYLPGLHLVCFPLGVVLCVISLMRGTRGKRKQLEKRDGPLI